MRNFIFALVFFYSLNSFAAHNEQSFTPDSLRKPIRGVTLENSTTHQVATLYQCAANTEAGCMVDITDETALQAIFSGAPTNLALGTYDKVNVYSCQNEGSYHAYINGTIPLNGTTYYTSAGADPLTTNIASKGEVQVSYQGCARYYTLPTPLVVTAGSNVEVDLFSSPIFIAWARLGTSIIPSGCFQNAAGTHSVCAGYPEVVPYVSNGATASDPALELYSISVNNLDNQMGAAVALIVDKNRSATDASGILAGFTRRIFMEGSIPLMGGFDTPVKSVSQNGDSTITLENYGGTATGPGYVRFPHFIRGTHEGDYQMPSSAGAPTQHYFAVKQDVQGGGSGLPDCAPDLGLPFTFAPMEMNKLRQITPLGSLNPSGHTYPTPHTYWGVVPQGGDGTPLALTNIYAPGALTINNIEGAKTIAPDGTTHIDYSMHWGVCKQLNGYFNHLNTLESNVMSAAQASGMPDLTTLPNTLGCPIGPSLPQGCKCELHGTSTYYKCYINVNIPLIAGQQIGMVGNHNYGTGWDFGLRDGRIASSFYVNPARHNSEEGGNDDFHVVCPIDYFTPSLASTMRSALKDYALNPVSASIGCGTVAQDVAGTALGLWYKSGPTTLQEDYNIALAKDNFNDAYEKFSIGNISGVDPTFQSASYAFVHQANSSSRHNVRFEAVIDTLIYCYDGFINPVNGTLVTILMQLISPAGGINAKVNLEKKMAVSCAALGAPASWSFGANAQQFDR